MNYLRGVPPHVDKLIIEHFDQLKQDVKKIIKKKEDPKEDLLFDMEEHDLTGHSIHFRKEED